MDLDARVRTAAFNFLADQTRLLGEVLDRTLLSSGFQFEGSQVRLIGPQGIFKPAILQELPLTITTVPTVEGQERPYEDQIGENGLIVYRYRGTNPDHHENVGLRLAMARQTPLIHFIGVVPGKYMALWPVFIVGDDPGNLSFTVAVEDRDISVSAVSAEDTAETALRRRYVTTAARRRLHQHAFRQRVLRAYTEHCTVCHLRHVELLEAAHILPDTHPRGEAVVPNGLALCKLHHAAFDANILGIRPDYTVDLRLDVLEEIDGPMLKHGLQGFQGKRLRVVPSAAHLKPNRAFLEERYSLFRSGARQERSAG